MTLKSLIFSIVLLIIIECQAQSNSSLIKKANEIESKWGFKATNKKIVTLIDFSRSIDEVRLYVVDVTNSKVIFISNVAHGMGSGMYPKPNVFSNAFGSNATSLGCYVTLQTYFGHWGYSLRLDGLENGKNNNALKRTIVVHSTKKMHQKFSYGCFSVPDKNNKRLIDLIKDGSLIYAYR